MDNKLKYEIDTSFQNYITVENLIKIKPSEAPRSVEKDQGLHICMPK